MTAVFNHPPQFLRVHVEGAEHFHCGALSFADQPEKNVFDADVVVSQPKRLLSAEGDHFLDTW